MTENAKMAKVMISMTSGKEYEFEMPLEKATMFVDVATHFDGNPSKQWVDLWDYTGAHSGQHLISLSKLELIDFNPI
jgi:hypothetical protein